MILFSIYNQNIDSYFFSGPIPKVHECTFGNLTINMPNTSHNKRVSDYVETSYMLETLGHMEEQHKFVLFIILSMINYIQARKGVKSMMKGFMGLTLDIINE